VSLLNAWAVEPRHDLGGGAVVWLQLLLSLIMTVHDYVVAAVTQVMEG